MTVWKAGVMQDWIDDTTESGIDVVQDAEGVVQQWIDGATESGCQASSTGGDLIR